MCQPVQRNPPCYAPKCDTCSMRLTYRNASPYPWYQINTPYINTSGTATYNINYGSGHDCKC